MAKLIPAAGKKARKIFNIIGINGSQDEFVNKFKVRYPEYYNNVVENYKEQNFSGDKLQKMVDEYMNRLCETGRQKTRNIIRQQKEARKRKQTDKIIRVLK
jgi:hypothetical protein